MVGSLNTFGNIPLLPIRIVNGTFQITQAGGAVTLYTVPAGKTLYLESKSIICLPTLEPVASSLGFRFGNVGVNSPTAVAVVVGSTYTLLATDRQIQILVAGETITLTNTLALGDCTVEIQITGYLL